MCVCCFMSACVRPFPTIGGLRRARPASTGNCTALRIAAAPPQGSPTPPCALADSLPWRCSNNIYSMISRLGSLYAGQLLSRRALLCPPLRSFADDASKERDDSTDADKGQ